MSSIAVGPDLSDALELCYRADRPVLLEGPTGVGKSQTLEACAKRMGIGYIVRDLSLMEAPDLAGMPIIKGNKTRYAPPSFLPTSGKGLLVFEELNRCPRYTMAPCLQLLTTRRLNDYPLPRGWFPVAAINPAEEGYQVEELDKALLARFVLIRVRADVRSWLKWADQEGVHPSVREFVSSTPQIFQAPDSNPRAWTYASDIIHAFEKGSFKKKSLITDLTGLVGGKLARAFCATYSVRSSGRAIPPEAIIDSYGKVRSHVLKWAEAGNTGQLESSCDKLLVHLQDPETELDVKGSKKAVANLRRFLVELPAEYRRKLLEHHPWLKAKTR